MIPTVDLSGQAAVITGSTSGIGFAMAEALAGQGCNIVLNGLGELTAIDALQSEIESRFGVQCVYHGADMTRANEIAELIAFAEAEFGQVDILLNNAGIQHVAPIEDFPNEQWERIIAINLSSAFYATKAAVPVMKRQARGRIVNLASAHGHVASPFKSAYVAAKHGVIGLTKSTALELATSGVTCNAICPGYVKTPLVEMQIADQAKARNISEEAVMRDVILAAQPTKRFVEYDEIAGALLYLVSDLGASTTGASLIIDGGWTAQ
jgi:3-hydroxybutyrate dehydrogenase